MFKPTRNRLLVVTCVSTQILASALAASSKLPAKDTRAVEPRTLNTLRDFPAVTSKSDWQTRAKEIREHMLVSCGLWPGPEKTPLRAEVFGKIERPGYTIEKVHMQPYAGFYLAGNLYRPRGQGNGPFPAILNPHGHWPNGRLADTADGSIAARCISFARQGMIAFSYDMVGYNDTKQVGHGFAREPVNQLWNISLMGLQTWNSVRALDFLASLPEVDKTRLACTGESGGGTQTFMLGALDDRLAAQAPIVMVSHSMQGGCLCENAPGLRVDYSNMEIAATPAPRPQILVGATGDWTKSTLTVEGPAIEKIYKLFNAADRFRYVRFDFNHNYNQTSREAVYESFGNWLLKSSDLGHLKEKPYQKEPDAALRVWPDGKLPQDALDEGGLISFLKTQAQAQLSALQPRDRTSLEQYRKVISPAWEHTLQIEIPERRLIVEVETNQAVGSYHLTRLALGREGKNDRIPAIMFTSSADSHKTLVILAHPAGRSAFLDASGRPSGLANKLLDHGQSVLLFDAFLTGELRKPEIEKARKPFSNYFTTYNRTDLQEHVQDVVTLAAFGRFHSKGRRVILCGIGRAGLWALLAAPTADSVIADCDALDTRIDQAFLTPELFVPGMRRIGAFEGAALLAAPNPLLLHNTGNNFSTASLRTAYDGLRSKTAFRSETSRLDDDAIVAWVSGSR